MTVELVLDQSALLHAGSDRGLGRYARAVHETACGIAGVNCHTVSSISEAKKRLDDLPAGSVYHALSPAMIVRHPKSRVLCSVLDMAPFDMAGYTRFGIRTEVAFRRLKHVDVVVPLSKFTAERVRWRYPRLSAEFAVCSLDIDPIFQTTSINRDRHDVSARPYVLAMADTRTPDNRKRHEWIWQLVEPLARRGLDLLVVGRGQSPTLVPSGSWLQNLSDVEMASLMVNAVGFFYPSAYEGQGMPPLEALAMGCPVLAFDNSAISEMIKGREFLLTDPHPWHKVKKEFPLLSRLDLDEIADRFAEWSSDSHAASEQRRFDAKAAVSDLTLGDLMRNQLTSAYLGTINR